MGEKKRLDYVDIAKYIGISLVMFGHMKMPNPVLEWIYAFHMPLFFVLSGYTYRRQKLDKEFVVKKLKTIYVPFLLFALIFCKGEMSSWAYIVYGSRNALNIADTYTVLWFLPCFFTAILIFSSVMSFADNCLKNRILKIGGVIALLVVAKMCEYGKGLYPAIAEYGYPFNFDMALVGAVFMAVGYCFRKIIDRCGNNVLLLSGMVIVLLAVTGITAFINLPQSLNPACPHVEMSVGALGNWPLFFLNASLMSFALIGLSLLIDKYVKGKKLMLFIGQNSLTLLCVHGTLLMAVAKVLPKLGLTGAGDGALLLAGAVSYIMVIAVSIPIIMAIKRFVPNLVGK